MEKLEELDVVIALKDLENGVKKGDMGTIMEVGYDGYLVAFQYFENDLPKDRVIDVLFEDVKPTEWTLKRIEERRKTN